MVFFFSRLGSKVKWWVGKARVLGLWMQRMAGGLFGSGSAREGGLGVEEDGLRSQSPKCAQKRVLGKPAGNSL